MSEGFIHSVKVPRFYKVTAKTVQSVQEEGASIKQLIYEKKHPNLRGTYGLAVTTIQHGSQLDHILRKTKLLIKETRLDPWLARVLITELLWGKKHLSSEAKPITTILSYEKALLEEAKNLENVEADVAANINKVQKPRYVRVNTLVTSVEDSIRSFTDDGWTLLPKSRNYSAYLKALAKMGELTFIQDFHVPELFAFPPRTLFHDHEGYQSGAIILQDKASCLPAHLLNAKPGSTVLDMCSAPGMKTTHLAAIMENRGKIIAVERNPRRYQTLCEIVKTNHADCVTTINADALRLMSVDPALCSEVEYILVDPSCSGSGMLDRLSLGYEASKCAPGRLINLQSFQVMLLRHALLNFPKAKRVVYSTCSMYPEENEMVVDEILVNIGDAYTLVPATKLIGPDWKSFSSTDYECGDKCLYARPDIDKCNGFFVAVFERNFDVPLPEDKRKDVPQKRKSEDENQLGKKKRRRRSKANGVTENGEVKNEVDIDDEKQTKIKLQSVAEETEDQENGKKSKKKRRKEIKIENGEMKKEADIDDEKQIKMKLEFVAEETEDQENGKKSKKKRRKEIKIENGEVKKKADIDDEKQIKMKLEFIAEKTEDQENGKKSKKKKRKEIKTENVDIEEHIEVQSAINGGDPSSEKKKKNKKRKDKDAENSEEVNGNSEFLSVDEQKSKKKKKKHSDLEILEVIPMVEISDEQKPKKKKKKHSDLEILEVIPNVEISDEQESKKKKKKHSDLEISEVAPKVEISDESKSKKKKKKKKDNAES